MPSCTLREIPQDVYDIVQKEQERIKKKKEVKVFSMEWTIFHIIRQYAKIRTNE